MRKTLAWLWISFVNVQKPRCVCVHVFVCVHASWAKRLPEVRQSVRDEW